MGRMGRTRRAMMIMSAMVVMMIMMMAMLVMAVMGVGRVVRGRGRKRTALVVSGEVEVGGGHGQGRPAGTTLMRTSMR
jgi:hypothetical protein